MMKNSTINSDLEMTRKEVLVKRLQLLNDYYSKDMPLKVRKIYDDAVRSFKEHHTNESSRNVDVWCYYYYGIVDSDKLTPKEKNRWTDMNMN